MNEEHLNEAILQIDLQGHIVRKWKSAREAANSEFKYSRNYINDCLRHKKIVYRGFLWVYESEDRLIVEKIETLKNAGNVLSLDGEEWRDIKCFEGLYQVSNLGRVKSLSRMYKPCDIILQPALKDDGYLKVTLFKGRVKGKNMLVHRLVAEAFIPNPDNLPIINHKDEDRSNNKVENLEWCTYRYNTMYSPSIGCTLNRYDMSLPVLQFSKDGEFIKEYPSIAEASRQTGANSVSISNACKGKTKTCYGFIWKYASKKIKDELSQEDVNSIKRILSAISQNSCKIIAPVLGKLENNINNIFGKNLFTPTEQ